MSELPTKPLQEQGTDLVTGPTKTLIDLYMHEPDSLSVTERTTALREAQRLTMSDGLRHKVVVEKGDAKHWGKEYHEIFTFNSTLLGTFEFNDPAQKEAELIAGPGAKATHVMIETDDGNMVVIRQTNNEKYSSQQTFDASSTNMHLGQEGTGVMHRPISAAQLKDVIVIPGEPLVLGVDPETGKRIRTRGNVTHITTIEDNPVADGHPWLAKTEKQRGTPGEFLRAVEIARTIEVASEVGVMVLAREAIRSEAKISTGADVVEGDGRTVDDLRRTIALTKKQTNDFVEKLRARAASENRELNTEETKQIQYMVEVIRTQEKVAEELLNRDRVNTAA